MSGRGKGRAAARMPRLLSAAACLAVPCVPPPNALRSRSAGRAGVAARPPARFLAVLAAAALAVLAAAALSGATLALPVLTAKAKSVCSSERPVQCQRVQPRELL